MLNDNDINSFFSAVDSLKKYRRAEITDNKGNSLIKELYVDALPNDQIIRTCLKDNTTFLVGRKGTGKSTIFLRLEEEYKSNNKYIACYIDAKTVYESGVSSDIPDYLKDRLPKNVLDRYNLQRTFIQEILIKIISAINKKYSSSFDKLKKILGIQKTTEVNKKLNDLLQKVENNEILKDVEIPILKEVTIKTVDNHIENEEDTFSSNCGLKLSLNSQFKTSLNNQEKLQETNSNKCEEEFSKIFLKVFKIKDVIIQIKNILETLKIKHLIVMLDDVSEIDESAIKTFIDTLIAPLNNWSDEFIKFKIAVYPGRIHYGNIDRGKIDIIELDFFNLYKVDRESMEERAIDFTKRLINNRIAYFCNEQIECFFDTKNEPMDVYYEMLFQTSMNIPRILGYILYYCFQNQLVYKRPINKKSIEVAAQTYYENNIYPFFDKSTYSVMAYRNKISILQQKKLIELYVEKLKELKRKMISGDLTSIIYDNTQPFTSHFYIVPDFESFLSTLELNFFITKYAELSDRDGKKVSIFAINYGLAMKYNLRWGKPKGNNYRKYFISRPFDFSGYTIEFLKDTKQIVCTNPTCGKVYPYDEIQMFKRFHMQCPECSSKVEIDYIANDIKEDLNKIDPSLFLPEIDYSILFELNKRKDGTFASEISEELDISPQLIGKRVKIMSEEKNLISRIPKGSNRKLYKITDEAQKMYF